MIKQHEFSQAVTDKVIDQMSKGTAPWQKPLAVGETKTFINGFNGFTFNSTNALILQMHEHDSEDNRWVDFNAAKKMNLMIAKGSKGVVIEDVQSSEKKPVLTENGEPVLNAEGKETFEYVKLERPIFRPKHFFNGADIENIGENTFKAEALPKGFDAKNISTLMAESVDKLNFTGDKLRLELARYSLAAKFGTGFEPTPNLDFAAEIKEDPRAFFRASRDAGYIAGHMVGDKDRKLTIEGYVNANTERSIEQEKTMAKREYIQVAFKEKSAAKELGARWDKKAISWYIPEKADQATKDALLEKFEAGKIEREPSMSAEQAFGEFLRNNGVQIDGSPVMNGQHHRVAMDGDKGKSMNGSYRGFSDGVANGELTNFRNSSVPIKWVHTGQEMTAEDRALLKEQALANREASEKLRAEAQDKAARTAFGVYANAEPAQTQHGYVHAKGITNQETLIDIKVGDRGDLIVPVRTMDGKITSAQYIKQDGAKFFQKGSAIKGGMHIVGDHSSVRKGEAPRILISEGFATAATLHEVTKLPVVVAFNGGNLAPVAEAVREVNPRATLIIAGDNDIQNERNPEIGVNVGRDNAYKAAEVANAKVILPFFNADETSKGMTDWNDLAVSRGDISKTVSSAIDKVAPVRSQQRESVGMSM